MRILLLTHGLPPESIGGVEQHVEGLSGALHALGHEVHIFARSSSTAAPQGALLDTRPGPIRITRAVYRWEGVRDLPSTYDCEPMATTLAAFLQQRRSAGEWFDVAHVHHLIGLSTQAMKVLRDHGLPVVLTLHDYWLACPRGQMWHPDETACTRFEPDRCGACLQLTFPHWVTPAAGPGVASALHQRALATIAAADRLVVPSARAIAPFVLLGVPVERFLVVENGVDTARLEALPPPACGPGPLRLGYLGTLLPSKGLHVLLQAVQQQPRGSVELSVFGNAVSYHGDDRYPLRCFGSLRPGDAIHYHGPYQTAELPALLSGVDVVCAPALWHEAFGLTIREALAAARPVLLSRIGGLQDAITDGVEGRLLPPGDVAAWAAAIAALAQDRPALRRMAQHCRGRARSFAAMAQDLLRVYGDLTGGHAAQAGTAGTGQP